MAWSAGLHLAIPLTPHTLSLQASNTNAYTLQGMSRGEETVRYGFEFTIPLTLSRWFGPGAGGGHARRRSAARPARPPPRPRADAAAAQAAGHAAARGDAQHGVRAGAHRDRGGDARWSGPTTTRWRTRSRRRTGSFDSGLIQPGRQVEPHLHHARHLRLHLHPAPVHEGSGDRTMNPRAAYSFACAAFAACVASASLAGCFSERVAGRNPPGGRPVRGHARQRDPDPQLRLRAEAASPWRAARRSRG